MTRKWCVIAGVLVGAIWFASPAHAQGDPTRCSAPIASSDERIAGCTAVIEVGRGPKSNLAWAYDVRARAYFETRDFDRAIADFSELIELDPNQPHTHNNRGAAYLRKGDFDRAIADYGQAIQLDPRYREAYLCRGDAYRAKGDLDRAMIDYNQAIQLDPRYKEAYLERGKAYRAKGDFDRAITDYDQAIQLDPNFKIAYLVRGSAYSSKGDTDRAIADYDEGIRLDPKNARAYRMRGLVNLRAGSLPKSLADLDQSQELDPKDFYAALWREIVVRRSDQPSHLADATAKLDMTKWPAPIVRLFLGETTPEAVLAAAENSAPLLQKGQVCEANFFAGELALQRGSKEDAARLFGLAATDCPKTFIEWSAAKDELKALGVNP
jgi:tetratricopeptide (TPR) repeat protein